VRFKKIVKKHIALYGKVESINEALGTLLIKLVSANKIDWDMNMY
jgi:hypothetical protein